MVLAQLCAIMPLTGVLSKAPEQLKFTWYNMRMLHTIIIMVGQLTHAFYSLEWVTHNEINITTLGKCILPLFTATDWINYCMKMNRFTDPLIWFASKFLLLAHSVWLARKWPSLMVEWCRVERKLPPCIVTKAKIKTSTQINLAIVFISVGVLSWATIHIEPFTFTKLIIDLVFIFDSILVEHTLSLSLHLYNSSFCSNSTTVVVGIFLKQSWPQIYTLIEYDGGMRGISGELLNYYCVLQWVFMDALIIAVSICFSTRIYQLNKHLKQFSRMVSDSISKIWIGWIVPLQALKKNTNWWNIFEKTSENATRFLEYSKAMLCIDNRIDCKSG